MVPGSPPEIVRTVAFTVSTKKSYIADLLKTPIYTGTKDMISYFNIPSIEILDESVTNHTEIILKVWYPS